MYMYMYKHIYVCMYVCMYVYYIYIYISLRALEKVKAIWPLQDIRLLRGCCTRIDHTLLFPPPICIAHPGAIVLQDYWALYDSPSDFPCVCYTPYNIGNHNIE